MRTIAIGRPSRRLEAVVTEPAGAVRGAAVVCHPHPQMGGDMHDPVVGSVAGTLVEAGFRVLRFNFGGVGASGGRYSGGDEETDDVLQAVAAVEGDGGVRVLAGYSFGAWAALRAVGRGAPADLLIAVAPPLAFLDWEFLPGLAHRIVFVAGDRDPYCPPARLRPVEGPGRSIELVTGADHFFSGADDALRRALRRALQHVAPAS